MELNNFFLKLHSGKGWLPRDCSNNCFSYEKISSKKYKYHEKLDPIGIKNLILAVFKYLILLP